MTSYAQGVWTLTMGIQGIKEFFATRQECEVARHRAIGGLNTFRGTAAERQEMEKILFAAVPVCELI